MKILLVYPPNIVGLRFVIPEGMARVATFLRKYGFDTSLISLDAKCCSFVPASSFEILKDVSRVRSYLSGCPDSEVSRLIDRLLGLFSFDGFDIVGFSVISRFQAFVSVLLADAIKKRHGSVKVVLGGPFFCRNDVKLFMGVKSVDFVVLGDGERALLDLVRYLSDDKRVRLGRISGLVYRKGEKVLRNEVKQLGLNSLPSTDYDGIIGEYKTIRQKNRIVHTVRTFGGHLYFKTRLSAYLNRLCTPSKFPFINKIHTHPPPSFSYQVSKGCIGKCIFCNYKGGQAINLKSPRLIAQDVRRLVEKYNTHVFFFSCNSINIDNKHLRNLCLELIKTKTQIKWDSFARPQNLSLDLLKLMKKSGCRLLIFGVESGSQKVLDWLNKGLTVEEAEKTLKNAKKAGIITRAELIINTPIEEKEDILETINFIKKNKKNINALSVSKFCLAYGSTLYLNRKNRILENWQEIRNEDSLKKLINVAIKNNITLELPMPHTQKKYFHKLLCHFPLKSS